MTRFVILVLLLSGSNFAVAQVGPLTNPVELDSYARVIYVSASTGSDSSGTGKQSSPLASIGQALSNAAAQSSGGVAVLVAAGEYLEGGLIMQSGTDLFGGFNAENWSRDVWVNRSVIDAEGKQRVLVAADNARLDGFEVTGGVVRGAGAGILIDGTAPTLTNNFFISNKTLGPENWQPKEWHETANDGAAVYCSDGGQPKILNNIFVANKTENGRGAGIAFDGRCGGEISRNVLMYNITGLNDPQRSSDGGAMSIFNWSSPVISDNIILANKALNSNDGGGIFVALWSSANVSSNLFVANEAGDDAGGLFVGGQEHRYGVPYDPLPPKEEFFVEVTGNGFYGNSNPSGNSGAMRFTMESRGLIANNIAAHTAGFYIQRSEVEIVNNTILEDVLFIETKAGLKPSTFRNNIVWGAFQFDTSAEVSDSLFRDGFPGEGNITGTAEFIDDSLQLTALASSYNKGIYQTVIYTTESLDSQSLVNRVVQTGDKWGVVKAASGKQLTVWGDLDGAMQVSIFPTYRQTASSIGAGKGAVTRAATSYQPKRINKAIELLESGQPVYYAAAYGGYQEGLKMADTWADYIVFNMEHRPLDFALLREFMRGLVDAGPTRSGHRTPAVIVVLPLLGLDEETVVAGGWMVEQALAQGVHGVHLARARDSEAVKRFVQAARYPIHKQQIDVLGEGLRGWGSHIFAAWVWGLEREEYLKKADVWPLNPDGEVMLGVKIEDQQALANVATTLAVPGLAFAEHGPRDMSLSYGYLEGRADPPMPAEVDAAGGRVLAASRSNGLFFLDNVLPDNVNAKLDWGVMIGAGRRQDAAEIGRHHTSRKMPW